MAALLIFNISSPRFHEEFGGLFLSQVTHLLILTLLLISQDHVCFQQALLRGVLSGLGLILSDLIQLRVPGSKQYFQDCTLQNTFSMRAFKKKDLPGQRSLGNTIYSISNFLKALNAHLHIKGTEESCKQRLFAAPY